MVSDAPGVVGAVVDGLSLDTGDDVSDVSGAVVSGAFDAVVNVAVLLAVVELVVGVSLWTSVHDASDTAIADSRTAKPICVFTVED
jgi:hypothetical protein